MKERTFEKNIKLEIWADSPEEADQAADVVLADVCSNLEYGLEELPTGVAVVADLHPDPLKEVHK